MKFRDTSAIVPLCVHESNTLLVKNLPAAAEASVIAWWGTRTECVSALMRQVRTGGMATSDERAYRHVLHTLAQAWSEILPSDALRNLEG